MINRSATIFSVRIFPQVRGEDKEEPDFQDDQPLISTDDRDPGL